MLKKPALLLILILLLSSKLYAEVFTVLNNNDIGANSFRDALTKASANGNNEIDYIYFNIPGTTVAAHTIKILTSLPQITSDVIIDAATQNGDMASVNGAKIVIEGSDFTSNISSGVLSLSSLNRFEVYGLVIKNFYSNATGFYSGASPILIKGNIDFIKLGDINKGNVFFNCGNIIASPVPDVSGQKIKNFIFKNNFLGLEEDGITIPLIKTSKIYLFGVLEALIGGDTKLEGNLIYGGIEISPTNYVLATPVPFTLTIKNNIITANINEKRPNIVVPRNSAYSGITTSSTTETAQKANITITENVFGSGLDIRGFGNADILINKNFFGTSRDLTKLLPIQAQALNFINVQGKILLGGSTTAEGNIFTGTNDDVGFRSLYPGAIWAERTEKIELSHNSFYCNPEYPFLYSQTGPFAKPIEVFLDNLTNTSVSGRTKPGARVELFYSDPECTNCQPKRYFNTVIADASGNWIYNGTLETGYTVLAGATLNGISSEFSDPRIYLMNVGQTFKITNQSCDYPNGKVEGVLLVNVERVEWLDEAGNIVGTSKDLINVPFGRYRLKAYQFGCIVYSRWADVLDGRPQLSFTGIPNLVQPSCGNPGSILNLYPNYYKDFSWLDENGNIVGKDRELKNVPAGSYTLKLVGTTDCVKSFGPYLLKNVTGPYADFTNIKITNTKCSQIKIGSIKGISANGNGILTYKWINGEGIIVGTDIDLENVIKGTYQLEIKDESACPPILSIQYQIVEEGEISLDETNAVTKESSCNSSTGFVKGILVRGATKYSWVDNQGISISNQIDLINVSPGSYKLIASNDLGCTTESKYYVINEAKPRVFPNYNTEIVIASCKNNNGSISINFGNEVRPASMRWINSSNISIGTSDRIKNLAVGSYKLYLTDENGCEVLFKTFVVDRVSEISLQTEEMKVISATCGQSNGSINNIKVQGGIPPYRYVWKNANATVIGSENNISNLSAGQYTLSVTDNLNCEPIISKYFIGDEKIILVKPEIDEVNICAPTEVNLIIKNAISNATYRLYESNTAQQPIKEQIGGVFKVNASSNITYFLAQVVEKCESERTAVNIVLNGAELFIPNSFSPNDDGINDFWAIPALDKYNGAKVEIYNRLGTKVFNYDGINLKFDGRFNGSKLPSGVYYYVISLSQNCRQLSGSLLIL